MEVLIQTTKDFVKDYMSHYDPSHDWSHIQRVLHLAKSIEASERQHNASLELNSDVITLSALLHDLGDRKYLKPGQDGTTLVANYLQENDCPKDVAEKVQLICINVSYSNETKHPEQVAGFCEQYPELRIVQDADRLDAIGAVGIARMFVYTGAKQSERGLSVEHFYDKLLRIEERMKTETGRKIAKERTERMKTFLGWYDDETAGVGNSS